MSRIRRLGRFAPITLAVIALALFAAACGDDDDDDDTNGDSPTGTTAAGDPTATTAGGNGGEGTTISVADIVFTPASVDIAVGDTVTWQWSGELPHSVVGTFNGEDVSSDQLTGGGSFEFTFGSAGTFDYVCGVHGAAMAGSVNVS